MSSGGYCKDSRLISKIDEQYHPKVCGTLSTYLCGVPIYIKNLIINLLENAGTLRILSYWWKYKTINGEELLTYLLLSSQWTWRFYTVPESHLFLKPIRSLFYVLYCEICCSWLISHLLPWEKYRKKLLQCHSFIAPGYIEIIRNFLSLQFSNTIYIILITLFLIMLCYTLCSHEYWLPMILSKVITLHYWLWPWI